MGFFIKTAEGWKEIPKECTNHNQLQGVFQNTNPEVVVFLMKRRVERFCQALQEFHPVHNASQFRGHSFVEPLTGAFSEKL